jgi:hypothetical protein
MLKQSGLLKSIKEASHFVLEVAGFMICLSNVTAWLSVIAAAA